MPHRAHPEHQKVHPVHVTLRGVRRLPSLRKDVLFRDVRKALGRTARNWFRVVHFSVQSDHVHLLVEADDKSSLSRGVMGLTIRLARAVNRVLGRTGRVWDDRFHTRALKSPREVRNGIVYVLMNAKKHLLGAVDFRSLLVGRVVRWVEDAAISGSTEHSRGPRDRARGYMATSNGMETTWFDRNE